MATIRDSLLETRYVLERAGDAHPEVSAEWLVGWVTGKSRAGLFADGDEELGLAERFQLMAAIARRSAGEPLQYITGTAAFRTIEVTCEPGVLIPRPETELLVELALEAVAATGLGEELRVLEIGTGTGCVALSIAAERSAARVVATDLAPEAVDLARRNASALGLSERVEILEGDLADPVPEELLGTFDLIVSNPPYVPSAVVDGLGAEVRDHEPRLALDGGADGLDVFRRLLAVAPSVLRPGGVLAVELFEESLETACDLVRSEGVWESVEIHRDLAGRPRHLVARLSKVLACDPGHPSPETVGRALAVLERDGVAVLPTDSVYGVGCLATVDEAGAPNPALAKVFEMKGRDPAQTLPLLIADPADLDRWGRDVPAWARKIADALWPGALTLVVRASSELPSAYRAADGTVGLRVPDCPLARDLARAARRPLAVTSANLHGEAAARSAAELDPRLLERVDVVLDGGPAPIGVASTVVDVTGSEPRVLRRGAIAVEDVFAAMAIDLSQGA